jgi:hypothetical protein
VKIGVGFAKLELGLRKFRDGFVILELGLGDFGLELGERRGGWRWWWDSQWRCPWRSWRERQEGLGC